MSTGRGGLTVRERSMRYLGSPQPSTKNRKRRGPCDTMRPPTWSIECVMSSSNGSHTRIIVEREIFLIEVE
jgi:hypothetical protein